MKEGGKLLERKIKIGIVTIISKNYGNRLQNYALQHILEELNLEVKTIPYKSGKKFLNIIRKIKKIITGRAYRWENFDGLIKYAFFSSKLLDISGYDYFVAGSDQIWNPNFAINSDREYLAFAKSAQKIAYAASIGVEVLSQKEKQNMREWLNDFSHISVREKSSVEIIQSLLPGQQVELVLDPTLMVDKKVWENLAKNSTKKCEQSYLVSYFLGDLDDKIKSFIRDYCDLHACEWQIISNTFDDDIGPWEFVDLIQNAEFVVTDSFHAVAFSIIFSKKFIVFDREAKAGFGYMSSRLKSLLDVFGLSERLVRSQDLNVETVRDVDYVPVQKVLEIERGKSLDYLKKVFDISVE